MIFAPPHTQVPRYARDDSSKLPARHDLSARRPALRLGLAAELSACGGDVATLRTAHGNANTGVDQRIDKAIDRRLGRTLHPRRKIRVFVERDGVDLGVHTSYESCQCARVRRRVVVAG